MPRGIEREWFEASPSSEVKRVEIIHQIVEFVMAAIDDAHRHAHGFAAVQNEFLVAFLDSHVQSRRTVVAAEQL